MTRKEKNLLGPLIKKLIVENKQAWWQLKREIFDCGFQTYYPSQSFFDLPAKFGIKALKSNIRQELIVCYQFSQVRQNIPNEEELTKYYTRIVVETIVARANVAANQTISW
jgi:hypothetical protein